MQIFGWFSLIIPVFFWAFLTVSVWVFYEGCKSENKNMWLYLGTSVLFMLWILSLALPQMMIQRELKNFTDEQVIQNDDIVESIDLLAQ